MGYNIDDDDDDDGDAEHDDHDADDDGDGDGSDDDDDDDLFIANHALLRYLLSNSCGPYVNDAIRLRFSAIELPMNTATG